VREAVGDGVQVGKAVGVDVSVGIRVGVGVSVIVEVTVGDSVGLCASRVGINNGVGGTIRVGTSQAAKALGEQPLKAIAPAPMPATFKKSRRETVSFRGLRIS